MDPDEPSSPVEAPFVVIGAGPAGLTAAYELVKRGEPRRRPRGRRRRRRHQPHRRARRVALRPRRAPLLHQGPGGRGPLARDPAGRGLPHAPAHEPHLLRGQVLRLPAAARSNALRNLGVIEAIALRRVLRLGQGAPAEGPDQLRELAGRAVRVAAVPALLQDLHREGLGRAGQPDARGLGRAAREGPDARQGDRERAPAASATRRRSRASSRSSSTRSTGRG